MTGTARNRSTAARDFALRGLAWSLGLFGLVRLGWIESHAIVPLTALQAAIARGSFGAPAAPIDVTLACSGADALALCSGAVLAYPAAWRSRLWGAGLGVALILALNVLRIGTLGRVAASPGWFQALHLYVWPAMLTLAIAAYVFAWMRIADPPGTSRTSPATVHGSRPSVRFFWLAGALLVAFTTAPLIYAGNPGVVAVTAFIARAAAIALLGLGIDANAVGSVLLTERGAFLVTPECVATPLIPVYLAAIWVYADGVTRRTLGLAAAIPIFVALGIARLLVVALPAALIGSPLFLIHAFYQLVLGAFVIGAAAVWQYGVTPAAWRRAFAGVVAGALLTAVLGSAFGRMMSTIAGGSPIDDPQGAVAFLPAFQLGLYTALCVAIGVGAQWRVVAGGFVLILSELALLAVLPIVQLAGLGPHIRDLRGWAVAAPLVLVVLMVRYARPSR